MGLRLFQFLTDFYSHHDMDLFFKLKVPLSLELFYKNVFDVNFF